MSPDRQAPEETSTSISGDVRGSLTERERIVLERVQKGETNREIARALGITEPRVKKMVANAMLKVGQAASERHKREPPAPLEPTPLAQLLRARREALGYSRPEVARHTGITESALDSYEQRNVKPRVDTGMLLARFYGISYVDLADAVGVPPVPEGAEITPAQAITAERMERGWTVERMASELGVTAHEVAAYERGDLEVTAAVLARVMRLPGRAQA